MEEMKKKLLLSIKHFLERHSNSLPPFSSASDPETPPVAADAAPPTSQRTHVPDPSGVGVGVGVEWAAKVIGFCLSWAASIALVSLQIHGPLPLIFHFPSHTIVIALSLLFVSNYIYPNDPMLAQVLENAGLLFGFTAFFFATTIPFSLCIKLIYWTIFALSLFAIFLIKNRP